MGLSHNQKCNPNWSSHQSELDFFFRACLRLKYITASASMISSKASSSNHNQVSSARLFGVLVRKTPSPGMMLGVGLRVPVGVWVWSGGGEGVAVVSVGSGMGAVREALWVSWAAGTVGSCGGTGLNSTGVGLGRGASWVRVGVKVLMG